MRVVLFLSYSGPYYYNGAEPSKITGVENYFDKSNTSSVNYSYIDKSWSYIDPINEEWNLCIPIGSSTTPNKWLVFDLAAKKWIEKVPSAYPTMASNVVDTNGARYNYGMLSTGQMLRLDNTQAWDGTAISQTITTGLFSPPMDDEFGFWTRSEIRAFKLISKAITENADVTVTIYKDGSASANTLTIPLDSGGSVSVNKINGGNLAEEADYLQIKMTTSTSSEKWEPLAFGYMARKVREP
jgi:hypothetical protein